MSGARCEERPAGLRDARLNETWSGRVYARLETMADPVRRGLRELVATPRFMAAMAVFSTLHAAAGEEASMLLLSVFFGGWAWHLRRLEKRKNELEARPSALRARQPSGMQQCLLRVFLPLFLAVYVISGGWNGYARIRLEGWAPRPTGFAAALIAIFAAAVCWWVLRSMQRAGTE